MDGVLRGAADLRIIGPLYRREAEAAFRIKKPCQSHGGSALLERSLLAARNRGIKLLILADTSACSSSLASSTPSSPAISVR